MRILPTLIVAAVLAVAAPAARANFTAVYTGTSGTTFNYTLRYTADQAGEQLRPGNFITIYDLPAITSATAPAGFSVSLQNSGLTPPGLGLPAITDDPALVNVTFTYVGSAVGASTDFLPAQIDVPPAFTATALGKAAGTTSFTVLGDQLSTNVTTIPALVPEPASLAVLSLGALALLARRRG